MSVYECLAIYGRLDVARYLELLRTAHGARPHPHQANSFLIGEPELPFYRPQQYDDHLTILSFNYAPLPSLLIRALVDHPGLAPAATVVRWMVEQEILMEGSLAELARRLDER